MAVSKATWEAVETKIVADMANGVNIGSYTIAGRSFSYRGLDEQRKLLQFVASKIQQLDGSTNNGFFQLTQMSNL